MISRDEFPTRKRKHKLSLPQQRVLTVLVEANGPISRGKIATRLGSSQVYVGKTVGYSDPKKRAEFERSKEGGGRPELPNPTLLTLGYIIESTVDVDGVLETCLSITEDGRKALEELGPVDLPPLR